MARPEYVRVRDKETGHHYSVTRERYDRTPNLWDELKSDAVEPNGDPVPMKPKTSVSKKATGKTATEPADQQADNPANHTKE